MPADPQLQCLYKQSIVTECFFFKEIPKLIIHMDFVISFIITLDILLLNYLPIQTHIVLKLEKIKRTKLAASHSLTSKHNSELWQSKQCNTGVNTDIRTTEQNRRQNYTFSHRYSNGF